MLCQISEQTMRNIFQAYIQSSPHNKTSNKMVSGGSAHWQHCLSLPGTGDPCWAGQILRHEDLVTKASPATSPQHGSKWPGGKFGGKSMIHSPSLLLPPGICAGAVASTAGHWRGELWANSLGLKSACFRIKHRGTTDVVFFFIPRPYLIPADAHAKLMKPPCGAKAAFPKSCHRICRKVHLFPDFGLGSWSWTLKTSRSKRYLECTVKTGQRWIHITDTTFHPRCFQLQLLGCSRIEIWTGTGQTKLCKETGNIKSDSSGEIEHRHFQRWLKKHEKAIWHLWHWRNVDDPERLRHGIRVPTAGTVASSTAWYAEKCWWWFLPGIPVSGKAVAVWLVTAKFLFVPVAVQVLRDQHSKLTRHFEKFLSKNETWEAETKKAMSKKMRVTKTRKTHVWIFVCYTFLSVSLGFSRWHRGERYRELQRGLMQRIVESWSVLPGRLRIDFNGESSCFVSMLFVNVEFIIHITPGIPKNLERLGMEGTGHPNKTGLSVWAQLLSIPV